MTSEKRCWNRWNHGHCEAFEHYIQKVSFVLKTAHNTCMTICVFCFVMCICGYRTMWSLAPFTWMGTSLGGHTLLWQQSLQEGTGHVTGCKASQPAYLACWERLHYCLTSLGDAGNATREPRTTSFIHCQGHNRTDLCLTHLLDNLSENKPKSASLPALQETTSAGWELSSLLSDSYRIIFIILWLFLWITLMLDKS